MSPASSPDVTHLSCGISCVPQGIPQMLSWSSGGVDHLDGQAGVTLGFGWVMGPVGLRDLLPHHHIEPWAGLVAEDKACIVVVAVGVDEEGTTKVHSIELIIT